MGVSERRYSNHWDISANYPGRDGRRAQALAPAAIARERGKTIEELRAGRVTLVGAGPGDPDLLTIKGRARLAACDAVVYDRLVAPEVVALAPPSARRLYVGKHRGARAVSQSEVNDLLVDLARSGLDVVRLKGGDPFVFGRGAEEADALARAGISFEVVPGVSAAVAGPESAGIPVTDRRAASSCAFVSGHLAPSDPDSRVDWAGLARSLDTIVVLMGMRHLDAIAQTLMDNGRPHDQPAAIVEWATTERQRTIVGTLADIGARATGAGAGPPAAIVFGDVVALRLLSPQPATPRRSPAR